ncbi:MAG TPA: addiction module protein [Arachidicoccus sp.]
MSESEKEENITEYVLTEEQMAEVERRRANYLAGQSNVTRWEDAEKTIGKKSD